MIAKMAGYGFRLRSSSYGGQVGSNPPGLSRRRAERIGAVRERVGRILIRRYDRRDGGLPNEIFDKVSNDRARVRSLFESR